MNRIEYRKLRVRMVLTIACFSLIPLVTLGFFIYTEFSTAYNDKLESNLQIIIENKAHSLDMYLQERTCQLRTLAFNNTFDQLSDERFLSELFGFIQSTSHSFIDIGVIDKDGNHVAYAGPYKLKGLNYKDERWFNEVMVRGMYISDVFMGYRNFPHFIIAVMRRENDKTWILRATIDSEIFNSLVKTVQAGKFGDAYLINGENILQTRSRYSGDQLSKVDLPRSEHFLGSRIEHAVMDGETRVIGRAWLNSKDWQLIVAEDPDEALSPLFRAHAITSSLMLMGAAMIIVGAFISTKAMIKKIITADREKAVLDASLLQSQKMASLGRLASGIAHEINNPLTLIHEGAGWIRDLLEEEDARQISNYSELSTALDKIEHHVDRAKGVTHRLLGFARRMEPVKEAVDLNQVAKQTTLFLETEARHRDILILKHFDPNLPLTVSDTSQLQQVILNILENAIEAIEKDGTVKISTGTNGDKEVYCRVEDNGPGIPEDVMNKIFDPFFTTKMPGQGTGIGMSVSYGIMQKLGGRIEVKNREEGGAAFTMCIPLVAPPPA